MKRRLILFFASCLLFQLSWFLFLVPANSRLFEAFCYLLQPLATIFMFVQLLSATSFIYKGAQLDTEVSLAKRQQQLKEQQDKELLERSRRTEELQSQVRNHLVQLSDRLAAGSREDALDILEDISGISKREQYVSCCSDSLINAILSSKRQTAQEKGIDISYQILLPDEISIPPAQLCSIFFNLLDNGIEACMASESREPFLHLSTQLRSGFLVIHMENSKSPAVIYHGRGSSKKDSLEHGFGLSIIEQTAEKYDGTCEWKDLGVTFDSLVSLRCGIQAKETKGGVDL